MELGEGDRPVATPVQDRALERSLKGGDDRGPVGVEVRVAVPKPVWFGLDAAGTVYCRSAVDGAKVRRIRDRRRRPVLTGGGETSDRRVPAQAGAGRWVSCSQTSQSRRSRASSKDSGDGSVTRSMST